MRRGEESYFNLSPGPSPGREGRNATFYSIKSLSDRRGI
jgi:hypothetical protein